MPTNDRTYISKFLSHIIKISFQSTDIIRSITHFQYFLRSSPFLQLFCCHIRQIISITFLIAWYNINSTL